MIQAKFIFRLVCLSVILIQLSLLVSSSAAFFLNQESDEIEISCNDSDESDFESLEDISDEFLNFFETDFGSSNILREFEAVEKNLNSYYTQSLLKPEIKILFSPPECKI
jgi:hypothetical protein